MLNHEKTFFGTHFLSVFFLLLSLMLNLHEWLHKFFLTNYHEKVWVVRNIFIHTHVLCLVLCETYDLFVTYLKKPANNIRSFYIIWKSAYYAVNSCKETHAKHGTQKIYANSLQIYFLRCSYVETHASRNWTKCCLSLMFIAYR